MKKIKNFVVFNSLVSHGQMNNTEEFYPNIEDKSIRTKLMRENKQKLAEEVGFDINNIFMSSKENNKNKYGRNTLYTLKQEDFAIYNDLYDHNVFAYTVKMTEKTPNAVIGFNVADCANVIAMNIKTKEATSTLCSGMNINNGVAFNILSTLGGVAEDIIVDVSPFAYYLPFDTTKGANEPEWLSNKYLWNNCVVEDDNLLIINQKKALEKQLLMSGLLKENIYFREDSLNNTNYYSLQRARLWNSSSHNGRFMHGVMYEKEGEEKEYNKSYIKKYAIK